MGRKTYLEKLMTERDGYIMINPTNGVTIKCTENFVEQWKKRGFKVAGEGKITLINPDNVDSTH